MSYQLLDAAKRCEQYLVLAVMDSKGDLKRIAERDLQMLRDAIVRASGDNPTVLNNKAEGAPQSDLEAAGCGGRGT